MPSPEQIAMSKRRLGALEYDFKQLPLLVAALEAPARVELVAASGLSIAPAVFPPLEPALLTGPVAAAWVPERP